MGIITMPHPLSHRKVGAGDSGDAQNPLLSPDIIVTPTSQPPARTVTHTHTHARARKHTPPSKQQNWGDVPHTTTQQPRFQYSQQVPPEDNDEGSDSNTEHDDDQSLPNVPFNPARMNRIAANAVRAFVRVATTELAIMSNFMAQIPDKQQHHPSRPSPRRRCPTSARRPGR